MILTIKQMQQHLLLAYQTSQNTPNMNLTFGLDTKGKQCINVHLFKSQYNESCLHVDIYEYMESKEKNERFKLALSYINGKLNPFEEEH